MAAKDLATPIKGTGGRCVICGKTASDNRHAIIQSQASSDRRLGPMIEAYIGVQVRSGSLCRSCEEKLVTIDKKVVHIKGLYTSNNAMIKKRCAKVTPEKNPVAKQRIGLQDIPCSQSEPPSTPTLGTMGKKRLILGTTDSSPQVTPNTSLFQTPPKQLFHMPAVPASSLTRFIKPPTPVIRLAPKQLSPCKTPSVTDHGYSTSPTLPPSERSIGHCLLKMQSKSTDLHDLIQENERGVAELRGRKHGNISVLQSNRSEAMFDLLEEFSWGAVCTEMCDRFPRLLKVLLSIMLPQHKRTNAAAVEEVLPRLGLIYSLLMQYRNQDLSIVQRLVSTLLVDSMSPVQSCRPEEGAPSGSVPSC